MIRRRIFVALAAIAMFGAARPAQAQGGAVSGRELWESAMPDAGAWISAAGRGGWLPGRGLGLGFPLVQAGLARGGWQLEDPARAPEGGPFPGLPAVWAPLSGYDSLAIEPVRAGDGSGPGRALSMIRPIPDPLESRGKPRARFGLLSGDFNVDETAFTAERGSERGSLHLEALSARRGIIDPYGEAGRHRWSAGLTRRFGAHELSGTFRQAGYAARLLAGEEQTARGASGRFGWTFARAPWQSEVAVSRQWDSKESFGGTLDPISRRDAQEARVQASLRRHLGERTFGVRADWNRSRIARVGDAAFGENQHDEWGAAWIEQRDPARRITLELGGGRVGATDEVVLAPAARLERDYGAQRLELWAERLLAPVWGDVASGGNFLQSTWTAGAGLSARRSEAMAHARVIAGRTRDRAVIRRLPLEEQWLRARIGRDPEVWQFVELWGDARWGRGRWQLGAEGCGLVRESAAQSRVDPDVTGRAFGECRFEAFRHDLAVKLRLEGEGVGDRETDEAAPRPLAGFVTANFGATITLGDAQVAVRVLNLENRRRADVWIDPNTGAPALGTPRAVRVAVAWNFKN